MHGAGLADLVNVRRLAAMITAIFEANHGTYGYRRIHAMLPRSGEQVSDELVRT